MLCAGAYFVIGRSDGVGRRTLPWILRLRRLRMITVALSGPATTVSRFVAARTGAWCTSPSVLADLANPLASADNALGAGYVRSDSA